MNVGDRLTCRKCGHEWYARTAKRPVQCPRCKSTTWDRELQVAEAKVEYKTGSKEPKRRKKYVDFSKLKSFGMWADLTETDEELLNRLGGGWAPLEWEAESGDE